MKLSEQESHKRKIYNNFMHYFATTCGSNETQGCRYSLPDAPFVLFNSVFDTNLISQNVKDAICAMKKVYDHKKQFCWWFTDFVKPQSLRESLEQEGFHKGSAFLGMVFDLANPIKLPKEIAGISVNSVNHKEQLIEWIKPMQVAFEIDDASSHFCAGSLARLFDDPRFKHFYVEDKGKIVGVGSLFTENGVSGFYNLGVLPEYRKQHIATALKCHRLTVSQSLGSKFAILQSSDMGRDLDQRLGFKPVFDFVPYLSPL